ncbi:unnamed protein product, partial [Arctogadus glacialis]
MMEGSRTVPGKQDGKQYKRLFKLKSRISLSQLKPSISHAWKASSSRSRLGAESA